MDGRCLGQMQVIGDSDTDDVALANVDLRPGQHSVDHHDRPQDSIGRNTVFVETMTHVEGAL